MPLPPPIPSIRFFEGNEYISLDVQPEIATMVENSNTISALLTHLNSFPHLNLMDNTSIEEITYGSDTPEYDLRGWPVVKFSPSSPSSSSSEYIAARLLIGADGPNSLVRKFAKIENRGWNYDRMGVVATLKCEPSWITPTAWQRFLPTGPIAHLPVPPSLLCSPFTPITCTLTYVFTNICCVDAG